MKPRLLILLFLLAVGAFYILTLRTGLPAGDDFAQYIAHARNIVNGKSYAQTGYIYNPHNAGIGPAVYPPLFPLMLAGVYEAAGMNFAAMKILNVVLWLTALYVFYVAFARELPHRYLACVLAALALNPYFWGWKDEIISDILFLLLCYAGLWLTSRLAETRVEHGWLLMAAAAICVYLAFATRTAAVVLIPTLVLFDLVRARRPGQATGAAAIALALLLAHSALFHGSLAYVDQLTAPKSHHSPGQLVALNAQGAQQHPAKENSLAAEIRPRTEALSRCLRGFMWQMESDLWNNASSAALTKLLCLTALLLGATGYALRIRRGPGVFEIFAAGYAAMILVWNAPDLRLLLPLIPLWILCAATALHAFWEWNRGRALAKVVCVAVIAQVVFAYGSAYAHAQYGEFRTGIRDPNFVSVCDYIKRNTPSSAAIIYAQPRLLALMTDRSASAYYRSADDGELWGYFTEISATHLILASWIPTDQEYLSKFVARNACRLREVFRNPEYVVYEIQPYRLSAALASAGAARPAPLSSSLRPISSATSRTMASIGVDGR